MSISQSTHKQSFIDILTDDIRDLANAEGLTTAHAATRVLIKWLGYESDEMFFLDGDDRGIDAWLATESGIDLFQIKTHDLTENDLIDLSPFDGEGIRDLSRAKEFFLFEQSTNIQRKPLKELLYRRDSFVRSRKLQDENTDFPVNFHLIILSNTLTDGGKAEFQAFEESLKEKCQFDDVTIQFYAILHNIDEVIDARWREDNRTWLDKNQRRMEEITLYPWKEGSITDNQNAIFYCRAIDLVQAYDALGYQLFEPNVRANIKTSRVNQAIRESVLHQRTRREFRFLNNGVTIICEHFNIVNGSEKHFRVRHPGIVNGLQTVVALHTAYQQLSGKEKDDFDENCSVLVRLLLNNAVDDITKVVKATNNQNPMKPRNLMSNTTEQLNYAKIFAQELGWFYEAKEGAWDAFEKDHKRWRPRLNKHPKEFRIADTRKVRRVDNEDLAQIWLAFIGFAHEAINERKYLFEDRFYDIIFKQQTQLHGYDYDFAFTKARSDAHNQSPSPSLMLVAFLSREFAQEMTPSASDNRKATCERLGIDPNLPKGQLDTILIQDSQFALNQALGGMSVLFTEFVGFILFRAFGANIHRFGHRLLQNHSLHTLAFESVESVKKQIDEATVADNDLLVVLWLAFVDTIEDMMATSWGQSYRAAPVKVRFTFSRETRDKLYRAIEETNEYMKKRSLKKVWAVGVADGQGLFEFIRNTIII